MLCLCAFKLGFFQLCRSGAVQCHFILLLGFPAGEIVHSLIGFENKGEKEFVITLIEGSLRCVYTCVHTYVRVRACIYCL